MHTRTRRQREVLEIITRYAGNQGYHPSYQQIAKHLGLKSRSGIARIVADLESQGLLERTRDNGHFSINPRNSEASVVIEWLDVPGRNGAGPIESLPLSLPFFMIGGYEVGSLRVLRARDSAMGPSIEADDILLIELRDFAREGQIIAAVAEGGEVLVRRHYRSGAYIELADANDNRTRIAADKVRIVGIFRGLIRPAG